MKTIMENIPDELKAYGKQYVAWKLVPTGKTQSGHLKHAKFPVNSKGIVKVNRPEMFIDWAMAIELNEKSYTNGIGIVVPKGLIGLDLDKCVVDGEIVKHQGIVDHLLKEDFYVEYSPSGTGIRAFTLGTTPHDVISHKNGIEVYSGHGPRFLTMTGNVIANNFGHGHSVINDICEQYSPSSHTGSLPSYMDAESARGNENVDTDMATEYIPLGLIKEMLSCIPCCDVEYWSGGWSDRAVIAPDVGWVDIGMAMHFNGGLRDEAIFQASLGLWDAWSATDPARYVENGKGSCFNRWQGFGERPRRVRMGGLIKLAHKHGWATKLPRGGH